jgi:H+/Cl- antiporter ClcA
VKRFVRLAAIGFALFSVFFWDLVLNIAELAHDFPEAIGFSRKSYLTDWLIYALPAILYGVLTVLYFHWFAKRVARYVALRKPDVQ